MNTGKNYIFVGAPPRSGSTLLQSILDSHKDIVGISELRHIHELVAIRDKFHQDIDDNVLGQECTKEQIDNITRNYISDILDPLLKKYKTKFISEKTPQNAFALNSLAELFPDAKLIRMTRDHRGIVASMLNVGRKAKAIGRKPPHFTRNVRTALRETDRYIKVLRSSHGLSVEYKDLVQNPEGETKRICEYLELDWDKNMIDPQSQKHTNAVGMENLKNSIWHNEKMFTNPDPSIIYEWENILNWREKFYISRKLGNLD